MERLVVLRSGEEKEEEVVVCEEISSELVEVGALSVLPPSSSYNNTSQLYNSKENSYIIKGINLERVNLEYFIYYIYYT